MSSPGQYLQHTLFSCCSSDGVLVTKVDIMTGATLPIPDTLLEVEGMDALALDKETWPEVREELRNKIGGVRAVLIRQIENLESSLIRCVIKLMWASERSH